jgi:REP element-mobilizing transposase RayT
VDGFAIEVCAYSVMANHAHLILRTRPDLVEEWTDEEVARRWLLIFPKRKDADGAPKVPDEREINELTADMKKIEEIRHRLSSLSWFMRCLNEHIARRANKEDKCTGRFWEGRYKCQVLLDDAAELAAMVYVDLNPIRAGVAETPEESDFTSVQDRIVARQARENLSSISSDNTHTLTQEQQERVDREKAKAEADSWLCPIDNEAPEGPRGILPVTPDQYLNLVDWTGRQIREDKKGAIPAHLAPILTRLDIETDRWLNTFQGYGSLFHRVVGKFTNMTDSAKRAGKKWWQGIRACRAAFSTA